MPVEAPAAPAVTPAISAPAAAEAAPAAAPAAAAAPAPAAESVMESFDKQFADLDESIAAKAPAKAAPDGAKPPQNEAKPPASAAKAPESGAKPPAEEGFEAPQSGNLIQVRSWGRRMADMAKNATTKVKDLSARIEELEKTKQTVPPDVAKIQADYERLQNEVKGYRSRLAESDYTKDPEYEEKYKRPYEQAYLRGRQAVKNLIVREPDEQGNVQTRPGTSDDFDKLYEMTDSEADAAAEAMFGPSARRVINLRDQAKERAEAAFMAVKENSAKHAEKKQQQEALTAQQKLALRGLWQKVNTDLQTKYEKWFGEHDDDKEWNEALAKGRQIAQQRFTDAYMRLAPEQRVVLDAQIFNRAMAFPAMKLALERLERDRDEYKKNLEELRGSRPGRPGAGITEKEGPSDNWEAEFDKKV